MLLTTLHWPDEIRSIKELELPDEDFSYKPAELQMAKQLVAAMTGEFEPEKYKDEYREALMKVIEAKVEGKQVVEPAPVEETGNLIDLMAALEASVNAAKQARGGKTPVSVKDAKKARAERPTAAADKAKADKKPARAARSARGKDAEEEARPARRRKSA
jgi:DNA end-binding protein Ku